MPASARSRSLLSACGAAAILCGCSPRPPAAGRAPGATLGVADSTRFTTGVFEGCPPEGSGGDPDLNRLKNRDVPPPAYEPMTIEQVLQVRPSDVVSMGRLRRERWSDTARREVAQWENRGVQVECYIVRAKNMEPETCNCDSQSRRDWHVWIAASPDDDRARSVVAEVSPRAFPGHPGWRLRLLNRLARDRARVRISGWLMWDQEHPEQVGVTRGTLMEVHPIHRIEAFSGGRWRSLDEG